jgi:hypothetical protein
LCVCCHTQACAVVIVSIPGTSACVLLTRQSIVSTVRAAQRATVVGWSQTVPDSRNSANSTCFTRRLPSRPGAVFLTNSSLRSQQSPCETAVPGQQWLDTSYIHCSILRKLGVGTTAKSTVVDTAWCSLNGEFPPVSSVGATERADWTEPLLEVVQ